ncbi:MAG: ATP-grasp domain-containing protein [Deltaproteobacteria bacterium]|nr:ATP-grasp domain-containing protein [Deltaproteobacteria bacterium]
MVKKHHVLVFPAGSEIGLEIFNSLKYNHHVEVYGASGKSDHASYVYPQDRYIEDEFYVDRPDFIDSFNSMLKKYEIEFIYPTHDTIANFLAQKQPELSATVITSCPETNHIARYKKQTYETFKSYDFCPEIFSAPYDDIAFPVFLKPDDGQGGKGTELANNRGDLDFYLGKTPDLLVTEYLPGEELSVDCFTDCNGDLLFVGPRTRERVQMGISFRTTAVELTEEVQEIASAINHQVSLNGTWFFQVKRDSEGRYKLLEFAPRHASTMGLYRHTGVNFALLSLFNAMGTPVEIMRNEYPVQLDRSLHNRFKAELEFSRVYIDYDETIIEGDRVHDRVMAFLYQCRNRGIHIVLLTKHQYSLEKSLRSFAISAEIFEEIIHISDSQDKWEFIKPESAIFIDNYWHDRRSVKEKLGIPVFDVDGIECLLC